MRPISIPSPFERSDGCESPRDSLVATLRGRVGKILERCSFPPAGSTVRAGISGGADSTALLLLARCAGLTVTAVHVDHGLRAGSASDAKHVEALARRCGASFEAATVRVAGGANLEARARLARYEALGPGALTGHTADDLAETMLLNLLRGAGLDGLSAMSRANGRVLRPLLGLRRSETKSLCEAAGLAVLEDPSNLDLRFRRNQVRHRLVPLLDQLAQRDIVPVLTRQVHILADEASMMDGLASTIDPLEASALATAPPALARRAVRAWLRAESDPERHPPSASEVERVLDVARGTVVACEIAGGRRVSRRGGRLLLQAAGEPSKR